MKNERGNTPKDEVLRIMEVLSKKDKVGEYIDLEEVKDVLDDLTERFEFHFRFQDGWNSFVFDIHEDSEGNPDDDDEAAKWNTCAELTDEIMEMLDIPQGKMLNAQIGENWEAIQWELYDGGIESNYIPADKDESKKVSKKGEAKMLKITTHKFGHKSEARSVAKKSEASEDTLNGLIKRLKDAGVVSELAVDYVGDPDLVKEQPELAKQVVVYYDDPDNESYYYYLEDLGNGSWKSLDGTGEVANKTISDKDIVDFVKEQQSNYDKHFESKKSEATKFGSGMAKRKDFSKTKNLGEIFDVLEEHRKVLKSAAEDMTQSKEDLEAAIEKLQQFEADADFLKQQSVKGIKKALTLKNSPEVQAAAEVEKVLKDAIAIIASDYGNIPDVKQLMVVLDSRYATRGSKILTAMEGQVSRAIDVDMKTIKNSIESGDVTEDDIMQYVSVTSLAQGVKDKGVATKVAPVLARMNAMLATATKVEEAVIDPKQFKELRDLVEQIVNEASTPKQTIRTNITALDKGTIDKVATEAKVSEGLLDSLKKLVASIKDKLLGLWDSFTSLFFSIEDDALEAAEVFDEAEMELAMAGISITEAKHKENLRSKFEVLTKSVLKCCDKLVKDTSLAGEFDDEVIYAEDAVKNAVESMQTLGEACVSLKSALSCHKNEDNMNVIGILADAITQIVADEEGEDADAESTEAEEDDQVEKEYSPEGGEGGGEELTSDGEPGEAPNPMGMPEPEL